jgi:hypothetical protein
MEGQVNYEHTLVRPLQGEVGEFMSWGQQSYWGETGLIG